MGYWTNPKNTKKYNKIKSLYCGMATHGLKDWAYAFGQDAFISGNLFLIEYLFSTIMHIMI